MSALSEWRKRATPGDCDNCGYQGLVQAYHANTPSRGNVQRLCFICSSVPGVGAVEYPEQHPYHSVIRPVLGAISMMLDQVKPLPKPKKPKLEGIQVRPMTRRK